MKLHGTVVKGLGLGAKLGYPTANLKIDWSKLSLVQRYCTKLSFRRLFGVYAARATVEGIPYNAAAVIGARTEPAQIFAEQKFQSGKHGQPLVEVHLLDFHGDLRGQEFTVDILDKISDIEKFSTEQELVQKIEHDIQLVKENF